MKSRSQYLESISIEIGTELLGLDSFAPQSKKFGHPIPWLEPFELKYHMTVDSEAFDVLLAPVFDDFVDSLRDDQDEEWLAASGIKDLVEMNYPSFSTLRKQNQPLAVDLFLFFFKIETLENLFSPDLLGFSNERARYVLNSIDSMEFSDRAITFSGRCYPCSEFRNRANYQNFVERLKIQESQENDKTL